MAADYSRCCNLNTCNCKQFHFSSGEKTVRKKDLSPSFLSLIFPPYFFLLSFLPFLPLSPSFTFIFFLSPLQINKNLFKKWYLIKNSDFVINVFGGCDFFFKWVISQRKEWAPPLAYTLLTHISSTCMFRTTPQDQAPTYQFFNLCLIFANPRLNFSFRV